MNTDIELEIISLKLDISSFNIIQKTAGKNVDANIYVNFKRFNNLISTVLNNNQKEIISNFPAVGNWAELDINIKEDAVLLNGFTSTNDSNNYYLNVFRNQEPIEHKLNEILPSNTSIFAVLGISDNKEYIKSYKEYLSKCGKINQYQLFVDQYKNKCGEIRMATE